MSGRKTQDSYRNIEKASKTWAVVKAHCVAEITAASAVLDDPAQNMVDIRVAQGTKSALLKVLALAEPPKRETEPNVPELYPTGGADD